MGGLFRRKQLQPPELTGDPLLARILPTFLKGDYRPLQRLLALESDKTIEKFDEVQGRVDRILAKNFITWGSLGF